MARAPGRKSASVPAIAAPLYALYSARLIVFGFFRSKSLKVPSSASGSVSRGTSAPVASISFAPTALTGPTPASAAKAATPPPRRAENKKSKITPVTSKISTPGRKNANVPAIAAPLYVL